MTTPIRRAPPSDYKFTTQQYVAAKNFVQTASVGDTAKILGVSEDECEELLSQVPTRVLISRFMGVGLMSTALKVVARLEEVDEALFDIIKDEKIKTQERVNAMRIFYEQVKHLRITSAILDVQDKTSFFMRPTNGGSTDSDTPVLEIETTDGRSNES